MDEQFQHETHCLLTVPLCYPGGVAVGVMQRVNKRSGCFTPDDRRVLDIVSDSEAMRLHNADLAEQARKTEALGYVAGFAHDIYNQLASLVTGLPTLRLFLMEVFDSRYAGTDGNNAAVCKNALARLATGKPLDTHFEHADLAETVRAQVDPLWLHALENRTPPDACVRGTRLLLP